MEDPPANSKLDGQWFLGFIEEFDKVLDFILALKFHGGLMSLVSFSICSFR